MRKWLAISFVAPILLFGSSYVSANEIGDAVIEENESSDFPHEEHSVEHGGMQHFVKIGDTLWKIAKEYHVDFVKLVETNMQFENPNLIYPDDAVNLPYQVETDQP
jgi:nucleoid-associated protein YgaU